MNVDNLICPKEACTGCLACYNSCPKAAIDLVEDNNGFIYPQINDDKCINCNICKNSCPYYSKEELYISDIKVCYAAWTNDIKLRCDSSSGGVFAAIAKKCLENDGVVYGAAFDSMYAVNHVKAETVYDLKRLQNSKYIQSNIGKMFQDCKRELEHGTYVVFSGTPCQIYGLKKYLKRDYENLFTIDIICHGVPSFRTVSKYYESVEKKYKSQIKRFSFRNKSTELGWENSCSVLIELENGKLISGYKEDIYFWNGFLSNVFLRECCYSCIYAGKKRMGDITIGDFWGIQGLKYEEKKDGVSLLIINSNKGKSVIDTIDLTLKERNINEAIPKNQTLVKSFEAESDPEVFYNNLNRKGFRYAVSKINPRRMYKLKVRALIQSLIGQDIYYRIKGRH